MSDQRPRYLIVTHIPFARNRQGAVTIDSLWARDLEGLADCGWPVRVCAPEMSAADDVKSWGPGTRVLPAGSSLQFVGFPPIQRRWDAWKWFAIRRVLGREVRLAAIVHSSNCFPPYAGLSYAHDLAVKLRKKTLFVIAEDFHDMLDWEWVRTGRSALEIRRRARQLAALDRRVRRSALTADLTFLHTPAAVQRYRNSARNGIAIRQPGHETEDVISLCDFEQKCSAITAGAPLRIVAACRLKPLKGLDLLIGAIGILKSRGIHVCAELYGDGPQRHELQGAVDALQLSDRVRLPGAIEPGTDVYRAISSGHLFAMPHRTTDFGRAFFDAMAGAAPVVAFRTPASIDTVRDNVDGMICAMDDVESLAAAIARYHYDRPFLIRCAANARERAFTNTRSFWYNLRSDWTHRMMNGWTGNE